MARYIATVHLVFEADSDAETADAVSAMLSENLMHSTDEVGGKPPLIDWGYLHDGRRYCHPTPLPEGAPEDLEGVDLTALAPAPKAMAASLQLAMALGILVTPRDKDQVEEYCEEYGKDPADMTEEDLEEMESDLENDRVWSDALASYDFIRRAREIVKEIPYSHDEDAPLVPTEVTVMPAPASAEQKLATFQTLFREYASLEEAIAGRERLGGDPGQEAYDRREALWKEMFELGFQIAPPAETAAPAA